MSLRKYILGAMLDIGGNIVYAQQVDVAGIPTIFKDNKPLRLGGGISASTVYYTGNDAQHRQPFTYFLSGNINLSIYGQLNLPFSFNLNNLGRNFTYPTLPNRLSVHPTYKWITGHIGDVSMAFSPYTLNGHQFTGAGVELTPGNWKIAAMAGRLVRKTNYNLEKPGQMPAYKRMGYGAKVRYDQPDYYIGGSVLYAKDDASSLHWRIADSLQILPKSNTAFSLEAGVTLMENLRLSGEYGISLLTRDNRIEKNDDTFFYKILGTNGSTETYHAFRLQLNYQLEKNAFGVGYERIEPDYASLGAYYFNNDYQNITFNYSRPFLKNNKANVAISLGLQQDDLQKDKEESTKRFVGSVNLNYTPSERLSTSLSYSNFQSYMNIKSQFDYINQETVYDNYDTLNDTQLSQNLSVSAMYTIGKNDTKNHGLNINFSLQTTSDKQGDAPITDGRSSFYNFGLGYNLLFIPQSINFMAAVNGTYSQSGSMESFLLGPTLGIMAKLFDKHVSTGFSASYNTNLDKATPQSQVLNLRWNAVYTFWKRHNLNGNIVWQHRVREGQNKVHSVVLTAGYAYSF